MSEREKSATAVPAILDTSTGGRLLTAEQFQTLGQVPPEGEWFLDIDNPNTRDAYRRDLRQFGEFLGVQAAEEFRQVRKSHVIAWRDEMRRRGLAPFTIKRKMAALSSFFSYLCDRNVLDHNPTSGVKRPKSSYAEGKTPALSRQDAAALAKAPPDDTLQGKRDKAILLACLFHGLRREEVRLLKVGSLSVRDGFPTFEIQGKGGKSRFIPIHPFAQKAIGVYLEEAGHGERPEAPLFQRTRRSVVGEADRPLARSSINRLLDKWLKAAQLALPGVTLHSLRSTAATNALENNADIAQVREWLGHASVATTQLYDKRGKEPEKSPTFKVSYE
jgi:site-specific recombinase XerD